MEVIIGLVAAVLAGGGVFTFLKYGKKWVSVDKIPEDIILETANKKVAEKMAKMNEEMDQVSKEAEDRARKARKQMAEQEEILIEREKKLNKRSKLLDEKSERY